MYRSIWRALLLNVSIYVSSLVFIIYYVLLYPTIWQVSDTNKIIPINMWDPDKWTIFGADYQNKVCDLV